MAEWMNDRIGGNHYSSNEFSPGTMHQYYLSMKPAKVQPELTRGGVTVKVNSLDHLRLVVQENFTELSFKEDEEWVLPTMRDERWSQVLEAWRKDGGTLTQKQESYGALTLYNKFARLIRSKKGEESNPSPTRAPRERNAPSRFNDGC